jgi:hypothetical protein
MDAARLLTLSLRPRCLLPQSAPPTCIFLRQELVALCVQL